MATHSSTLAWRIPGTLVIVDQDPLENMDVLAESQLRAVVQGGAVVVGAN